MTGKTNDGGIDGRGILRIGLVSFPVIFQCKRYHDSVGSTREGVPLILQRHLKERAARPALPPTNATPTSSDV